MHSALPHSCSGVVHSPVGRSAMHSCRGADELASMNTRLIWWEEEEEGGGKRR